MYSWTREEGPVVEERLGVLQEVASRACGGTASSQKGQTRLEGLRAAGAGRGSREEAALAMRTQKQSTARLPALLPD